MCHLLGDVWLVGRPALFSLACFVTADLLSTSVRVAFRHELGIRALAESGLADGDAAVPATVLDIDEEALGLADTVTGLSDFSAGDLCSAVSMEPGEEHGSVLNDAFAPSSMEQSSQNSAHHQVRFYRRLCGGKHCSQVFEFYWEGLGAGQC